MTLTVHDVIAIVKSTPGVMDCQTEDSVQGIVIHATLRWWAPYILNSRKIWLHLSYVLDARKVAHSQVDIRLYSWRGKLLQS